MSVPIDIPKRLRSIADAIEKGARDAGFTPTPDSNPNFLREVADSYSLFKAVNEEGYMVGVDFGADDLFSVVIMDRDGKVIRAFDDFQKIDEETGRKECCQKHLTQPNNWSPTTCVCGQRWVVGEAEWKAVGDGSAKVKLNGKDVVFPAGAFTGRALRKKIAARFDHDLFWKAKSRDGNHSLGDVLIQGNMKILVEEGMEFCTRIRQKYKVEEN